MVYRLVSMVDDDRAPACARARVEHPGGHMTEEWDAVRRERIAERHPELPREVVDGLARLEKINEEIDSPGDIDLEHLPATTEKPDPTEDHSYPEG